MESPPPAVKLWEAESIWKRGWAATERVIVLMWLGGLHYIVEIGMEWRLRNYPLLVKFLDIYVVGVFAVIYVTIVLDMLAVFVSRLRVPNPYQRNGSVTRE